jgi:hypothetical protein
LKLVIALILFILSVPAFAQSNPSSGITVVGGVLIKVPAPEGFAEVTPADQRLMQFVERTVPPTNRLIAAFLPTDELDAFRRGSPPRGERYFMVETLRALESHQISDGEWAQMRVMTRTRLEDEISRFQPRVDEYLRQFSEASSAETGKSITLQIGEIVPLGLMEYSDLAVQFGMLMHGSFKVAEATGERTIVCIASVIRPQNKLLYLYAYAKFNSNADVDWAKAASKSWTDQFVESNHMTEIGRASPLRHTPRLRDLSVVDLGR